jgi:hypothetical protein
MYITEKSTGKEHKVKIEPASNDDFRSITKSNFFFDWKTEKKSGIYKLRKYDDDQILGLMSFFNYHSEQRIEIKLLAVSKENRGKNKRYERIAGTLIGFCCKEAVKRYGIEGCVSLIPKTELKEHYIIKYNMIDAGYQVFLEGVSLLNCLNKYKL